MSLPGVLLDRLHELGTYFLVVESNILFETNTCSKALMYCFSLYYILNMEYSKEVREFFMFLQLKKKKRKGPLIRLLQVTLQNFKILYKLDISVQH